MLSQISEQKVTANGVTSVNGGIYVGGLVIWGWPEVDSWHGQKILFSLSSPDRIWSPQRKGKVVPMHCVKEYGEVEI